MPDTRVGLTLARSSEEAAKYGYQTPHGPLVPAVDAPYSSKRRDLPVWESVRRNESDPPEGDSSASWIVRSRAADRYADRTFCNASFKAAYTND